jgi:1-acyl-sn-glycerol-3-phosphate acyltransferase
MQRRARPHVGLFIRTLAVVIIGATNALVRRRWQGLERIPASGPAIVAANHVSYADPVILARFIWDAGRVPRYLAKSSLFRMPLIGWIVSKAGQIPVERGSRDAAGSLRAAAEALHAGEVVVVYPEGTVTRDPDFWPMTAKTGLARLALLVPDVPVVPVGQWGAQHAIDVYHRRYRPLPRKTVTIRAGEPVDLSAFRTAEPTAQVLRELTTAVMIAVRDEVAAVRGQEAPATFSARPKEAW